jgi:ElaB/YqjD/DUF883 family membrane-anchored ribosome-binding protein
MHPLWQAFIKSGGPMSDIQRFIDELEAISEHLNDAAMSALSEAIENGQTNRPEIEKRLSQARRAVDKAIHHLKPGIESPD